MKKIRSIPDPGNPTEDSGALTLRQQAEAVLGNQHAATSPGDHVLSPEQARELLHDMHVQQGELEMQNEELRRKDLELEAERQRYFQLYEHAPLGYCIVSEEGLLLQTNLTAARLLGVRPSSLHRPRFSSFICQEDQGRYYLGIKQLLSSGQSVSCEVRLLTDQGTAHWVLLAVSLATALSGTSESGQQDKKVLHMILSDIDERKKAEDALRDGEEKLRAVFDASNSGIAVTDRNGKILEMNKWWRDKLGYEEAEIANLTILDITHPLDSETSKTQIQRLLDGKVNDYQLEKRFIKKDFSYFWGDLSASAVKDKNNNISKIVGVVTDITERKKSEETVRLAAKVFQHALEGIMITALDGSIIEVNDAFTEITGYSRDEALGQNPRLLKSGRHSKEHYQQMWRDLAQKGVWVGENWNRRKNGEIYPQIQKVSTVRDEQGRALHYVSLFSDITAAKNHEQELERIARYDSLTKLPNRALLGERLEQALNQTRRRGQHLAVVFIDLDGFKAVNDTHGHEAGDHLLITLAERMKGALRDGDILARLGGDEFVAVLLDLADVDASAPMLNRLLEAAARPFQFGEARLQVSASLGVTFYPQAQDQAQELEPDQLLRQADQAMYQAKQSGKNRFYVFDAEQDRSVRSHHENMESIRRALVRNEFVLEYLPKVNLRTGAVIGVEALIRWLHPQRGLLPPADFLPMIQDHPLAIELGQWVIESALLQVERWQRDGLSIAVSVNIGRRHLMQADFVQSLREALVAHPGVKPCFLEIELLEANVTDDLAHVARVIQDCRSIGVESTLDDFGSGHSSLTGLKKLPVKYLKIEQNFIRDMLGSSDSLLILIGVLKLAGAFDLKVIAEGVETAQHGSMLLQLGCELAQGYGIAPPMPGAELPDWVKNWKPDPTWGDVQRVRH